MKLLGVNNLPSIVIVMVNFKTLECKNDKSSICVCEMSIVGALLYISIVHNFLIEYVKPYSIHSYLFKRQNKFS